MRYHVIWSTYGSWLPGDPRGFRTKHHRRHVDGDYRNPPPPGKYEALHARSKASLKGPAVVIPPALRATVGWACIERFDDEQATVRAISVGGQHAHAAFEWAGDDVKPLIGRVKKVASHRVRDELPGRIWALGCKIVRVRDEAHWRNVVSYVKEQRNAWVWSAE